MMTPAERDLERDAELAEQYEFAYDQEHGARLITTGSLIADLRAARQANTDRIIREGLR